MNYSLLEMDFFDLREENQLSLLRCTKGITLCEEHAEVTPNTTDHIVHHQQVGQGFIDDEDDENEIAVFEGNRWYEVKEMVTIWNGTFTEYLLGVQCGDLLEVMIDFGVDGNSYVTSYDTPSVLFYACGWILNTPAVETLLSKAKCNVNRQNSKSYGRETILTYMYKLNPKNSMRFSSYSTIDYESERIKIINLLLENGANPYIKNGEGLSFYDMAQNDFPLIPPPFQMEYYRMIHDAQDVIDQFSDNDWYLDEEDGILHIGSGCFDLEFRNEIRLEDWRPYKTTLVNVKVEHLRPEYQDLERWMDDKNNVYIGRFGRVFVKGRDGEPRIFGFKASIWANPYKPKDHSEDELLEMYRAHILREMEEGNITREDLISLRGKKIGCWCAPERCHGEVILELLEADQDP